MAEGVDSGALLEKERLLVPVCLARNWCLSPRLHVHWFGNTRGT
jgi:hypothetical protein